MGADRGLGAGLLFQIVGGGEVVGMGVGVEDPLDGQPLLGDVAQNCVGVRRAGGAGLLVEIEDGVDDGAAPGRGIGDDILDAPGARVEEAFNTRRGLGVPVEPAHRAGKIEAARPAEGLDLVAFHAPVEHFAKNMEHQRAHAALAVGQHRTPCLGERLLEGADVGLGDARPGYGYEGIVERCCMRSCLLCLVAGLGRLFAIRPRVDDHRKAFAGEFDE